MLVESYNKKGRLSPTINKKWLLGLLGVLCLFVFSGLNVAQGTELLPLNGEESFERSAPEKGSFCQMTSDGGYIMTSYTFSLLDGSRDIYIVKTNADGNKEWEKIYGGSHDEEAHCVQQTLDGGYIVSGYTSSWGAGGRDLCLLKLDAEGKTEWEKTFGGSEDEEGNWVQQTKDGDYVVLGYTKSFGNGDADLFLLKTNHAGKKIWQQSYGGREADVGRMLEECSGGDFIVLGSTRSYGDGSLDIYLLRCSSSGKTKWKKALGGSEDYLGYLVQQTGDGNCLVMSYIYSPDKRQKNACIMKVNNYGKLIWETILSEDNFFGQVLSPPVAAGSVELEEADSVPAMPEAKGLRREQ